MNREQISLDTIDRAGQSVHTALTHRLMQKGFESFSSSHEILGILLEEFNEMSEEVRSNNIERLRAELLDIAVAAQFSIACIDQGVITR